MPTTVACPTGGEYRDALFNTATCFKDPDLVDGKPTLDALGLPKAVSGAFASVFTIESADENRWAVKCFTRFVDDQAARYQQIGRALACLDDPWKVGFEYLPDGVRCRGRWYPALKMEWVEAMGLIQYVEEHLWDAPALASLAAKFASMVEDLRRHGIAHGDLQHGNILVTSAGEMKLIDYDGMFVPGLDDFGASENGHANYQSPARTLSAWGPDLDHFSAWIIYASIVALTVDPTLWSLLRDPGDEALLFHKEDFTKPASSRAWLALTHSPDATLQALGEAITPLWTPDVHAVPALDVAAAPSPSTRAFWTPPSAELDGTGVESNGVAHGASPTASRQETSKHEGRRTPEFAPVSFGPSRHPLQVLCVISLVTLAVVLLAGGAGALPEGAAVGIGVGVVAAFAAASVALFRRTPERRSLAEMRRILAALRDEAGEAEGDVGVLGQQRGKIEVEERAAVEQLARRSEEARVSEQAELTAVDTKLAARLTELGRQRGVIQSNEAAEKGAGLRQLQHMAGGPGDLDRRRLLRHQRHRRDEAERAPPVLDHPRQRQPRPGRRRQAGGRGPRAVAAGRGGGGGGLATRDAPEHAGRGDQGPL
jgi:hypothetical protein